MGKKDVRSAYLQHELLHGVYLLLHMCDAVFDAPYDDIYRGDKKTRALQKKATDALGDLYQELGKRHYSSDG